ncbi:MAG: Chromate transport protein ChrA [Betaproteobacteria bacterium]|jgi:chromate transporter|nr:Chromate transport protein ChrA [Betaproteobacteria bacterium]
MSLTDLAGLCLYFMMLSFLAIGGAPSVLPEMHRYVVELHALMSSAQFAQLYSLAQVAPGPNVMYVPLIGWHVAGWIGAVSTMFAVIVPSFTLTLFVAHLHARHPKAAFGIAIRRGLTPITIGLLFATVWILLPAVNEDWRGYVLTALTVLLVLRTSLNPIWLLAAGAVAGLTGIV